MDSELEEPSIFCQIRSAHCHGCCQIQEISDKYRKDYEKYYKRCLDWKTFTEKLKLGHSEKISDLKNQNKDLMNNNIRQKEEFEDKLKLKDNLITELEVKVWAQTNNNNTLVSDLNENRIRLDEINKELENKNKIIKESEERVNKLKAEMNELSIELLVKQSAIDDLKDRQSNSDKSLKSSENMIKYLTIEKKRLLNQTNYYRNTNEKNKRKFLAVSATAYKQRKFFRLQIKKNLKKNKENNGNTFDRLRDFVNTMESQQNNLMFETYSNTCHEIRQNLVENIESEERILEKRADGRINCGSCDQTFTTGGHLQQHMTTTHKMTINTEKREQMIEEIDDSDDDIFLLN